MAKNENKEKTSIKTIFKDFREYWNIPKEGNHVPYKEYISVFLAVGGDYALARVLGFISFGLGCYLIMYYYEIPILTFSIIGAFFMVQGYFWSIMSMIVNDNLGFLPKKTERAFYTMYLTFAALGILFLVFDFSEILPFPTAITNYVNRLSGINMRSLLKIFAAHWFVTGYGGARNIFIRKRWLPKLGRYKLFAYPNVIPCVITVLLICWLPIYKETLTERVWQMFLLFQIYGMFGYRGGASSISSTISPNTHERMLVRCFPEKLSHLFNSLIDILLPIVTAYAGGITNINTFRYVLPVLMMLNTVIMFSGLSKIRERIPQPPIEKKKYIPFWDGISGVMKNKYRWINAISGMIDALGNGGLAVKTIILIYTWRELGIVYSIVNTLVSFIGNPGAFLAPWIRKKFKYKNLMIFKRAVFAAQSAGYIAACYFFQSNYKMSGAIMLFSLCLGDALTSGLKLAEDDMNIRINDYQMYLSGERLENYGGVIGWFTSPVAALISLIIPLLFYRYGFTSDWDVLFVDSIRTKCMIIGVAFDLVGHLLCMLPYMFFWDYTDEKHDKVMETLKQRADEAEAELIAEQNAQAVTTTTEIQ